MDGHVIGDSQDGHTLVEVGHADGLVHYGGQGFRAGDQLVVGRNVVEELEVWTSWKSRC